MVTNWLDPNPYQSLINVILQTHLFILEWSNCSIQFLPVFAGINDQRYACFRNNSLDLFLVGEKLNQRNEKVGYDKEIVEDTRIVWIIA